ncbi:MAG: ABC transporter permease subunit, partial [Turicibacter sp.]
MVRIVRLISAECYKLLKSKTFKIIGGIALALSLLMVASSGDEFNSLKSLNITTEHEKQAYLNEYLMQIKALPLVTPGQIAFQPMSETSPFELTALDVFHASFGVGVVEILLGILIGTHVASEYSSGTIKNTLAYGAKRNQYYLAKFMSLVLGAAIIVGIMTLVSTSIVTGVKGWGQPFEMAHLIEIIFVYCGSLIVFSAVIALLMLLASLIKSNGATI